MDPDEFAGSAAELDLDLNQLQKIYELFKEIIIKIPVFCFDLTGKRCAYRGPTNAMDVYLCK
jgi:hypothetical protein